MPYNFTTDRILITRPRLHFTQRGKKQNRHAIFMNVVVKLRHVVLMLLRTYNAAGSRPKAPAKSGYDPFHHQV